MPLTVKKVRTDRHLPPSRAWLTKRHRAEAKTYRLMENTYFDFNDYMVRRYAIPLWVTAKRNGKKAYQDFKRITLANEIYGRMKEGATTEDLKAVADRVVPVVLSWIEDGSDTQAVCARITPAFRKRRFWGILQSGSYVEK